MPFEVMNRAFVFFRRSLAVERAKIFPLARSRILLREYSRYLPDLSGLIILNRQFVHIGFGRQSKSKL